MADIDLSSLENLTPEARRTVESALKRTLDTELARASEGAGTEAMAFSRSRGFFFSRSKTSDSLLDQVSDPAERAMVDKLESLDEASFSKFADRLTTLKKIAREP